MQIRIGDTVTPKDPKHSDRGKPHKVIGIQLSQKNKLESPVKRVILVLDVPWRQGELYQWAEDFELLGTLESNASETSHETQSISSSQNRSAADGSAGGC